jgi:hypothetical protein
LGFPPFWSNEAFILGLRSIGSIEMQHGAISMVVDGSSILSAVVSEQCRMRPFGSRINARILPSNQDPTSSFSYV